MLTPNMAIGVKQELNLPLVLPLYGTQAMASDFGASRYFLTL